jgi:hypothetical protein
MKYWEIIADSLSKAGWSRGLRFLLQNGAILRNAAQIRNA